MLKKSNYTLVWKDCGKLAYKVFRCSIVDIQLSYEMKKLQFSNVSAYNEKQKRIF